MSNVIVQAAGRKFNMLGFLEKVVDYTKEAVDAGKYLVEGLSVTFDHMRRRPVTVQYPYEKLIPLSVIEEEFIMNLICIV